MRDLLNSPDMIYLIYVGVALGVLLVFTGLTQLTTRGENRREAQSRRMRMIARGASTEEVLALLKPEIRRGFLERLPFVGDLPTTLRRAGINLSAERLLALLLMAGLVVFLVAVRLTSPLIAAAVAIVVAVVLPIVVIRARAQAKTDRLIAQLPDALDLMARGLRVGHPLNVSIGAVAREMADPIGTEFGLIYDQVSYGDDLVEAFGEFAERVDLEDVHYLSVSIAIQFGTGGDLARVVHVLSRVIRDRMVMRRRIKAITAEGRLSAWFLSAIPIVIFVFTSISSPTYFGGVADDPLFRPMMMTIAGLVIANFFLLRRLVQFRF